MAERTGYFRLTPSKENRWAFKKRRLGLRLVTCLVPYQAMRNPVGSLPLEVGWCEVLVVIHGGLSKRPGPFRCLLVRLNALEARNCLPVRIGLQLKFEFSRSLPLRRRRNGLEIQRRPFNARHAQRRATRPIFMRGRDNLRKRWAIQNALM